RGRLRGDVFARLPEEVCPTDVSGDFGEAALQGVRRFAVTGEAALELGMRGRVGLLQVRQGLLHPGAVVVLEGAVQVPRQRLVEAGGIARERRGAGGRHRHLLMRRSTQSRRFLRPWNSRVFTVPSGTFCTEAISASAIPSRKTSWTHSRWASFSRSMQSRRICWRSVSSSCSTTPAEGSATTSAYSSMSSCSSS